MEKARIDISLVLPNVDSRDKCVERLIELLEAKEGIDAAHLLEPSKERPDVLCIHFDPKRFSLGEVRGFAHRAGAELDARFGHLMLKSQTMHARKARTISERLEKLVGVLEAAASPDGVIRIEFDRQFTNEIAIREAASLGLWLVPEKRREEPAKKPIEPHGREKEEHEHGGVLGANTELIFACLCGGLLLVGWFLSVLTSLAPAVPWAFYLAAYFFGGYYTAREAVEKIASRRFEIDFLMLVAAVGAAFLDEWAEGALLLFLFSLGHALERYAMGRARRAIEALAELAPETAMVRRNGELQQVPVEELQPGDVVVVKPNERIPADGFVIKGEGSVNQAPITGESMPVDKRPVDEPQKAAANPDQLPAEHRVFAGTINESAALEIQVTKRAQETTLARVVEMVSEAETQKSPTQRFTDEFERYFVPSVIGFAVLLLFAWVAVDEPFSSSFYRAMAVLVAASPCALAISTPSAVLSGVACAARGGVLVKGGGPLEKLGMVGAVAFDKTGTLTEGKPKLTDVVPSDGVDEFELLRVAIAVEKLSDHPLAAAVVRDGQERLKMRDDKAKSGKPSDVSSSGSGSAPLDSRLPEAHDLQSITGRGVKAMVDGQVVYLGKHNLFSEIEVPPLPDALRQTVENLESNGRTTMIVLLGNRYLGTLGLMDTPREPAKEVIAQLRKLRVRRMIMLSGDNQRVADAIAQAVGLDESFGDLMPDDKVELIKKLRHNEEVAMVGDGVNDAPALANATVGIAMGAAGSDVALETADVALMADDLTHLPFAIGLSRQTRRIIRQNLWISLGMVAVLVPSTLLGMRIGAAVVFHEGSTLFVVFNALRLLVYRIPNRIGTN